jgi:hypothetical protein
VLVDYLQENYVVWPWDITSEANKDRLTIWWCNIFPGLPLPDLQVEHCPMLIGIMLCALREEARCPQSEYEYQVLQRCDLLPQTNTRSTTKNVVQTLRTFKQEWHRNRQFLVPFDFVRSTGLCPDVVIEITKYLSLVDTINAFSIVILPLLEEAHAKIHLVNPWSPLLEIVRQHLDPRQIASLRLTNDFQIPRDHLPVFLTFDQLSSVTVISEQRANMIDCLQPFLPNVRRLSLWLNVEICSDLCRCLTTLSWRPIIHLQIRCTSKCVKRFARDYRQYFHVKNTTITSFIFDMKCCPRQRGVFAGYRNSSNLFAVALEFIGSLVNIRRVRFVMNQHRMQRFLRLRQWEQLIGQCLSLERVIIQVVDDDGDLTQEAEHIEKELRQLRPGIVFRIKSA